MTSQDQKTIARIASRANLAFKAQGVERSILDCMMDIEAAHAVCPLNLADLADAKDFDFAHDVFGIAKNLNHTTFELDNCFSPRHAQRG